MTAPDAPDRFEWPPARAARPGAGADADENAHSDVTPLAPPAHSPMAGLPRAVLGALRSSEGALLGGEDRSMVGLMRADGWAPDHPGRWCPGCGSSVGAGEVLDGSCGGCRGSRPPWDGVIRLGEYGGALREAIHRMKYRTDRAAGRGLGEMLGASIADALASETDAGAGLGVGRGVKRGVVLVPIPISLRRRLARGIDHTLVMARAAGWSRGWAVRRPLRRRHRPAQTTLPRSARLKNVRGSIRVAPGRGRGMEQGFDGAIAVVLDDVMTTGSTMRAACRALREVWNGPVWAAAAGVTPDPERRSGENGEESADNR